MAQSTWSAAPIPNASQAQLAYQERPAALTLKGVGRAANGFAIRSSARSASRTRAWASWSRRQPASTSSAGRSSTAATSAAVGARPSSTKRR